MRGGRERARDESFSPGSVSRQPLSLRRTLDGNFRSRGKRIRNSSLGKNLGKASGTTFMVVNRCINRKTETFCDHPLKYKCWYTGRRKSISPCLYRHLTSGRLISLNTKSLYRAFSNASTLSFHPAKSTPRTHPTRHTLSGPGDPLFKSRDTPDFGFPLREQELQSNVVGGVYPP
jgi:hypothetical protein